MVKEAEGSEPQGYPQLQSMLKAILLKLFETESCFVSQTSPKVLSSCRFLTQSSEYLRVLVHS